MSISRIPCLADNIRCVDSHKKVVQIGNDAMKGTVQEANPVFIYVSEKQKEEPDVFAQGDTAGHDLGDNVELF